MRMALNVEPEELGLPAYTGDTRPQPFITWLQFINFVTVAMFAWIFLKVYNFFLNLYEWAFPKFTLREHHNPLILVIGTKTKFTSSMLRELSRMSNLEVFELNDNNANNTDARQQQGGIVWCHVESCDQQAVANLSKRVRKTFGSIDVLILSEHEKAELPKDTSTSSFLANLNTQLLTQFWLVMAFLPSMMEVNHGHIISVAFSRTSSLTNTGVMRTVYEDLIQSDTKVKLTLVERNRSVEKWCPGLSTDLLTRMLLVSALQAKTSQVISVPTFTSYLPVLPTIILRLILRPLTKVLHNASTTEQRWSVLR